MKKGSASEMLLTIGILLAASILLLQLKNLFSTQQNIGQKSSLYQFATDLSSIIDKAASTTGNAAFNYKPILKKYVIDVSNNKILITDKISGKNTTIIKNETSLASNIIEDSEDICVTKTKMTENKIIIKIIGEKCQSIPLTLPSYLNIINHPALPSKYDSTRWGYTVDMLVYHYTEGDLASTLYTLADDPNRRASVHYVIDRDGTIYKLVDEEYNAWHAGCLSTDPNCVISNINPRSIGIEIVNLGDKCDNYGRTDCEYLTENPRPPKCTQPLITDYWETYDSLQMNSLVKLSANIIKRHPEILPDRNHILGHDEIYCDKHDPGPAFSWNEIIARIQNELAK